MATGLRISDVLISIHALREEGDPCVPPSPPLLFISIHALREEGDMATGLRISDVLISIHALREEGDQATVCYTCRFCVFLSTPSARRATR